MDEVQAYALAHPLNRANNPEDLPPLTDHRTIPGGNLLTIILAVDR
jgi:hypothetical protein